MKFLFLFLLFTILSCQSRQEYNTGKGKFEKAEEHLMNLPLNALKKALLEVKESRISPALRKRYPKISSLDVISSIQDSLNNQLCRCYSTDDNADSIFYFVSMGANIYSTCEFKREEFDAAKAVLTLGIASLIGEDKSTRTYKGRIVDFLFSMEDILLLEKIAKPEYGWDLRKIDTRYAASILGWSFLQSKGLKIEELRFHKMFFYCNPDLEQDYTMIRYLLNHNYPVNQIIDEGGNSMFHYFMLYNPCDNIEILDLFKNKGADLQTKIAGKSLLEVVIKRHAFQAQFKDEQSQSIQFHTVGGHKAIPVYYAPLQFEYLLKEGVKASSYPTMMDELSEFSENDDFLTYFQIIKRNNTIQMTSKLKNTCIFLLKKKNNPKCIALLEGWN